MASVPSHPLIQCVTELIRLKREGNLISLEGFGHVVDILEHIRNFASGQVLPMTADDEQALTAAVEELGCELEVSTLIEQQIEQFRLRPRPIQPATPDGTVLPASGLLITILLNLLQKWMSDPEMQARIIAWIISLFGGGLPMPATEEETPDAP